MSITGDIYNIDQSLTGDGITDLELNSLLVDGTFQKVDASYFNNVSSNIQTQLNTLSTSITNNANLNYAFKNTNNDFTGSLNKFVSIECSNNVKTLNFNGYQASFLEGATSNLQQQILALQPTGNPINGQSATIAVGTTTTLSPGSNAYVTNTGTNLDGEFNFGIPRGLQGLPGNPGTDGITPTFEINPLIDNLASNLAPYVTITQNPTNNYILKFGLVKGANGNDGISPTLQIGSVTTGLIPNVTIDNTILTNPKLNFTLVNGITPTFTINPIIENLASGSTPYVTITQNPLDVNNYILKFGLVQGAKGDKGNKGDTPSQDDILSIINAAFAVAGIVSIAALGLAVIKLQFDVTTLQGAVAAITTRVSLVELRTTGINYVPPGLNGLPPLTNIANDVVVGATSSVVLSSINGIQSQFKYGLYVPIIGIPAIPGITTAVSLNAASPSNFNLGIIVASPAGIVTTGLAAGVIGCASVTTTGDISVGGVFDVTGESNFAGFATFEGETNFTGLATFEGETNFAGSVTIQFAATFEAEANFAGAVTIEGLLSLTGYDMELTGGSIIQAQLTNEETGLPTPISSPNTFFDTNFVGNITQTNLLPNNPLHTPTTTLLDTSVKSLSVTDGDITQSSGTSTLYNLDVIGTSINIGDNFENNSINIGNSQSAVTIEGETLNFGTSTLANTINIGNTFTTLTLRSNANEAINIENIMDQMDMDINQILNEINGF